MNRLIAASALSAAVGLAIAMQGSASAADPKQMTMEKMQKEHLEKCYGINAVAKNDCAEGAHSCAGQATQARDGKSFVLVPAGACGKIQGGSTKPI
jgi:uncharacterized membrane protein